MYYEGDEKKSNTGTVLGVFKGKKQTYNKLILKSLFPEPKTVKQISIFIYQNERKKHPKNVYSVIDRPKGRLWELSSKGYIERKEGRWQLTFKGLCVALTLFKSLDEVKPVIEVIANNAKSELFKMFEKSPIYALVKTGYVDERVREALKRIESDSNPSFIELFLLKLKEYTEGLIKEGVDLDVLPVDGFTSYIFGKLLSWFSERYVSKR